MSDEIQIIGSEDGIALIGDADAVDAFLRANDLPVTPMAAPRVVKLVAAAGAATGGAAGAMEQSGRWIKITKESAEKLKSIGPLTNQTTGRTWAALGKGGRGGIKGMLEIEKTASMVNPGAVMTLSTQMQQLALQQAIDEMRDYLEEISVKVDELLRRQKDDQLALMVGVGMVIDDALTVRDHVGRVSDVTWSKVEAGSIALAHVQAYALRQLDSIAGRLADGSIGDLYKTVQEVEAEIREWLAVVARCVELQDGISVLELDRVMDSSPEDLENHRQGLRAARERRLAVITRATARLVAQLDAAAEKGNKGVLLHPKTSPGLVRRSNQAALPVADLQTRLGLEPDREDAATRRWVDAVADVRDGALDRGKGTIGWVAERGEDAKDLAVGLKGKVASIDPKLPGLGKGKVAEPADDAPPPPPLPSSYVTDRDPDQT